MQDITYESGAPLKIGITALRSRSMFTNGIVQNAIYLANLFIELGHDVKLLTNATDECPDSEIYEGLPQIKYVCWEEADKYEWDVIFSLGIRVGKDIMEVVRQRSPYAKLVRYHCGNQFIFHAEKILFDV